MLISFLKANIINKLIDAYNSKLCDRLIWRFSVYVNLPAIYEKNL